MKPSDLSESGNAGRDGGGSIGGGIGDTNAVGLPTGLTSDGTSE